MEISDSLLSAIASCIAASCAIFTVWKSSRDKRFDEIKEDIKEIKGDIKDLRSEMKSGFEKLDRKIEDVRYQVIDIRERVSFLEATAIFMNIRPDVETSSSARSEAAKKMWVKRNTKKLEQRD